MGRSSRPSSPARTLVDRTARLRLSKTPISSLLLLVFALIGCGGDPEADAGAVEALLQEEVAAINAKDLNQLAQIWSENHEILLFDVPPPGRFRGWDQIARVFRDFFDRFSEIGLTVDEVDIGVVGDLAYASYDWALTGKMGDATVRDRGQATSIYRREESGWRLVHAHFSPVPAAVALESVEDAEPADSGETEAGENDRETPADSPSPS